MNNLEKELITLLLADKLNRNQGYMESLSSLLVKDITIKGFISFLEASNRHQVAREVYNRFTSFLGEDKLDTIIFNYEKEGVVSQQFQTETTTSLTQALKVNSEGALHSALSAVDRIVKDQYYSSNDLHSTIRERLIEDISEKTGSMISKARIIRPNIKKGTYSITWGKRFTPEEIIEMIIDYGYASRNEYSEVHLIRNRSAKFGLGINIPALGITLNPCDKTLSTLQNLLNE